MKIHKKLLLLLCVISLGAAIGALSACNTPVDSGKTSSSDFTSSDGTEDNSSQTSDISGGSDSTSASDSESETSEGSSSEVHTHEYIGGVCSCGEQDSDFTGEAIEYRVDSGVYTGAMKDGVPHGSGVLTYDDGKELTAEFTEGTYSSGTLVYTNGNVYEGDFDSEGRYSGTGRYTFSSGMYYEGEYVAGLREGEGLFTWSTNGDLDSAWLFRGTFKADKAYYGKTTTTKTQGLIWYEGYMNDLNDVDTTKLGKGFYDYANGCSYTGELYSTGALLGATFHGDGKFVWSGSDFVGEWKDGTPLSGTKTFYAESENKTVTGVYKGEVNASYEFHGTGRYTFSSGMYYEGEYVNNLREGEGLFTWSTNGDLDSAWLFKGTFKAGKAYYGKTTTTKTAGLLWYEGYMNDLNDIDTSKRGKGYVYFSDTNCTYTGELYSSGALETSVYDGEGRFTWPGSDLVGSWSDGVPTSGRKRFYKENENLTPTRYYEGTFKNWNYEGKGRYDYLNGCWYEGDFVNNVFEGEGIFSWNKELGKGVYLVGRFSGGAAVSGTKYWPTRTAGLLEYTGKFSNTDNIDITSSGSGKYAFPNGDIYEGGLQVTIADGTESTLTGTGRLIYAVPSLSGKELGLDGEAASLKVKEIYGEFTSGEINGSAVYYLTDGEGNAAGYITGRYDGVSRIGAIDANFEYTLPEEYERSKDYTPVENEA